MVSQQTRKRSSLRDIFAILTHRATLPPQNHEGADDDIGNVSPHGRLPIDHSLLNVESCPLDTRHYLLHADRRREDISLAMSLPIPLMDDSSVEPASVG